MRNVRDYRLEICWFLLVVALFALSTASPRAEGRSWDDMAAEDPCPPIPGWCDDLTESLR